MAQATQMLRRRAARTAQLAARRLRTADCEMLEGRILFSTVVVNSIFDQIDPVGSSIVTLRDAIAVANTSATPTTITFSPTVFTTKKTITLNGSPLLIQALSKSDGVTITGPTPGVIISGNNVSSDLVISSTSYAFINGLTFSGGKATNGGGVNNAGTLVLQNSTVSSNAASSGGGIYNSGTAYVIDDTISANTATVGGGIWNRGSLTMANDTVAGNDAYYGGGVFNSGGSTAGRTTMINVTVSANTAEYAAGVFNNTGGSFSLANTIVAGNIRVETSTYPTDVAGVFASKGFNLIGNADGGSGFVSTDRLGHTSAILNAQLNPLGNYGGPTQTMTLKSNSPALSAGSTALVSFTTDQRGLPRTVAGRVDIGAIQTQPSATLPIPIVNYPGTATSPGPVLTTFVPTFSWQGITAPITGFQLTLLDKTTNKTFTYVLTASATSFKLPAGVLLPAHQYSWNLRALSGTVAGTPSITLYFQSSAALPTPTLISPGSPTSPGTPVTTLTPTFKWNGVTGITGYQLTLYNVTLGKVVTYTISPSATSFTVPTAIASGDTFVWNLRVVDGTVAGPASVYLFFHM